MDKKFLITQQGKDYVVYAGLLDMAHNAGLKAISTTLVQIPNEMNGGVAICHATVEVEAGTFTGIGDASPANVSRMMAPRLIRMAETRAKARALRDAVNVGVTALEELGDAGEGDADSQGETDGRVIAIPRQRGKKTAREYYFELVDLAHAHGHEDWAEVLPLHADETEVIAKGTALKAKLQDAGLLA